LTFFKKTQIAIKWVVERGCSFFLAREHFMKGLLAGIALLLPITFTFAQGPGGVSANSLTISEGKLKINEYGQIKLGPAAVGASCEGMTLAEEEGKILYCRKGKWEVLKDPDSGSEEDGALSWIPYEYDSSLNTTLDSLRKAEKPVAVNNGVVEEKRDYGGGSTRLLRWAVGMENADEFCKRKGFAGATAACQASSSLVLDGFYTQGIGHLTSNNHWRKLDAGATPVWGVGCWIGMDMAYVPNKVQCYKSNK
jgi:hypothetical protein